MADSDASKSTPAPAQPAPAQESKEAKKPKAGDGSKRGRAQARGGAVELQSVMGTRDFYPDDMRLRNWLFGNFKEVARTFAFQEYDAPVLELDELYKRKAGEEITQQMYNFKTKDDYEVTLRPEMTPSLARMILKELKSFVLPLRYFLKLTFHSLLGLNF